MHEPAVVGGGFRPLFVVVDKIAYPSLSVLVPPPVAEGLCAHLFELAQSHREVCCYHKCETDRSQTMRLKVYVGASRTLVATRTALSKWVLCPGLLYYQ
jgi:hypothetical protein